MSQKYLRYLIGISILLFQIGMIGYARIHPMRYCCWAPFDSLSRYRIHAVVNGRQLNSAEFRRRYHISPNGFDQRSIQHVKDILIAVEQRQADAIQAELNMTYTTNSVHPRKWKFSQHSVTDVALPSP